ncbi:MAG: hypothetical protein IPK16_28310 [Anaerolineales bacterium]|nr:hypothetical protein [Anaerolineales bacterium]
MINRGPVDVVVVAGTKPRLEGKVLQELEKATAAGTIRVLDVLVLMKDAAGDAFQLDFMQLPDAQRSNLKFIQDGTHGLFDVEDTHALLEGMAPGSAVVALAIEHVWAIGLVNAIYDAGAETAINIRVPAPVVDEAFATLSAKN